MDNFKFVQASSFTLAGSGASLAATTVTLSTFKQIDGTTNLTMTDFGTIGFGTIEPNTSREEQICFTGVTQNSNGTATLTGVSSVLFVSPYTKTSGLSKSHAGGTKFIISNTAGFYDEMTSKDDDETVNGTWTFTAVPGSTAAPISPNDITNKTYVDNLVNGGAISQNAVIVAGTAGATLVAGNLIYLKTSDGRWYKTDGTDSTTVNGIIIGISQGAGTAGNAISGGVLIEGVDTHQSALGAGTNYYVSDTAGAISASVGTTSRVIGKGTTTTTNLYLNPYFNTQPTDKEKTALTSLVSYTNGYAADAGASDTYVITLSPVPAAYTAGMTIRFKANTANTGAATLNVNSLGAISIVKNQVTALTDNDILAGQIVEVVYNGTNFQMLSPVSNVTQFKSGINTAHDANLSEVITIAHGLGKIPKLTTITAVGQAAGASAVANNRSYGTYDGTNTASVGQRTNLVVTSTTNVAYYNYGDQDNNNYSTATITVDITNIVLTWTKTGTIPGGSGVSVLWQVQA